MFALEESTVWCFSMREQRSPFTELLDAAIASGSTGGLPDQLDQLEELLAALGPSSTAE